MERTEFLSPVRFAGFSGQIENLSFLLSSKCNQNVIFPKDYCAIKGKGHIVLDFGKEYFGGIRILTGINRYEGTAPFLRIRFGESLMEANSELGYKGSSNDHSTRDMTVYMSSHSDMTWGSTAFRFVRIDFLEDADYQLEGVSLAFVHEEEPAVKFECSDKRLNEIFNASTRTLFLNKHNGLLWEGAKRDQHIWAGDLYPSISAALLIDGTSENIKRSLDFIIENYPLPTWYNGIPSYNLFFVLAILKYVEMTGDYDERFLSAVSGTIDLFGKALDAEGEPSQFGFVPGDDWGHRFYDWANYGSDDAIVGIKALLKYTLQQVSASSLPASLKGKAVALLSHLSNRSPSSTGSKTVDCMLLLSDSGDRDELISRLSDGLSNGYSAFLSIFLLESLVKNDRLEVAYSAMKEYFGGMIEAGGTTLFEEFDRSWLKNSCRLDEEPTLGQNDFHGDFGKECYTGYRKSLCHAWACSPTVFVIENLVGLKVHDGGKAISLAPNLMDLDFIAFETETKYGPIRIRLSKDGGREIECPKEITIR